MIWDKKNNRWKGVGVVGRGHLQVTLFNRGSKAFMVHRLVYQHFVGPIPEGYVIHHIDGNPQNNIYTNLTLLKRDEHTSKHKIGNKYKLNKHLTEQIKQQISDKLKQYNKAHPMTQQQRKVRSQNMKRIWAERKLERGV